MRTGIYFDGPGWTSEEEERVKAIVKDGDVGAANNPWYIWKSKANSFVVDRETWACNQLFFPEFKDLIEFLEEHYS